VILISAFWHLSAVVGSGYLNELCVVESFSTRLDIVEVEYKLMRIDTRAIVFTDNLDCDYICTTACSVDTAPKVGIVS